MELIYSHLSLPSTPSCSPFALQPNIWTPIQPSVSQNVPYYQGFGMQSDLPSFPQQQMIEIRSPEPIPPVPHQIFPSRTPSPISDRNFICLVCDTNIYIHYLHEIWRLVLDSNFSNFILGIPWKIHKELDGLKKSKNWEVARNARKAANLIEFILKYFNHKTLPQNKVSYDRAKYMFLCEDSDDTILQSILQLKSEGTPTVLYSKDTVLKNKAMCVGIQLFEFLTPSPVFKMLDYT